MSEVVWEPEGAAHHGHEQVQDETWDDTPGRGAAAAKAVNMAGAAMSLALIVGLGIWGYRIVVRDVTGVPVVAALDGPMRIAPEDPGGEVADHTGLAVNDVAAEGEAADLPDEITLAPGPATLSEEDLPLAAMVQREVEAAEAAAEEVTPASEAADGELVEREMAVAANLPDDVDPNDPVAVALALAGQVSEGAEPLSGGEAGAAPEPVDPEKAKLAKLPGVKRSLRPRLRPAGLEAPAPSAEAQKAAPVVPESAEVARAEAVPAGTRLVQLGAFESPEEAAQLWARLAGQFDSLMVEKSRLIMEAESGGKTFYRLRAQGFADLSDARRFCAALVAERAECIPVVAR
ncbi:SPOR domain-containing protein [Vannielia litorea]|uniref:SPOR domain-containing protein n=1 Tax=Vannielia litorea TaxID=1217970 RepID=UPI001BD16E36|nr:SPOR domain-containing protein [Vannielia litorea]MBS8228941.1 SPOR domain-containing protein [Vannielia litorea]